MTKASKVYIPEWSTETPEFYPKLLSSMLTKTINTLLPYLSGSQHPRNDPNLPPLKSAEACLAFFLESKRSNMNEEERKEIWSRQTDTVEDLLPSPGEHWAQFILKKTTKKEKLGIWKTIPPLWALASFKRNLYFNSSTILSSNKIWWWVKQDFNWVDLEVKSPQKNVFQSFLNPNYKYVDPIWTIHPLCKENYKLVEDSSCSLPAYFLKSYFK